MSADSPTTEASTGAGERLKVMVYSDDRNTREQIRLALGTRVAADLPPLETEDVATGAAVIRALDAARYDALIFDGEAVPVGGMGLAYQIKDEVANCPPVLVLIGRQADAWLASWSRAEAVVPLPLESTTFPTVFADMVRRHRRGGVARAQDPMEQHEVYEAAGRHE